MHNIRHKNVVELKKVYVEPAAIMLEYVYFDFSPFCPDDSPHVHSLEEFLSHLDATDAVASFPLSLQLKLHLHQSGIYRRDLRTSNVLVSNTHYSHIEDQKKPLFKLSRTRL